MSMFLALIALAAAQPPEVRLARPFEGMEFLIGHCWQASLPDGKTDTHCFEPVYGGRFIRDRHEVTGGYRGETLYSWDAANFRAEYTYWASSGGVSRGTMRERDGLLDFADVHRLGAREIRLQTTWKQIDPTSYEVRATTPANPTGARVLRYTRLDAAPVRIEESVNPDGSRRLSHELVVPATPQQVFEAFASAEGWRTWAVPHAWQDQADRDVMETSYTPAAQPGQTGNIKQRFLVRVPGRLVAFRTIQTPPRFPHAAEFMQVTSLVELEPIGNGTRVRLSGNGYPAGAAGDTLLGFFREGNRTSLEQLRARFVSGPVDWAARQRQAGSSR
jgi:uncharacterized protein YndB with AHSA1/START domain